jgi:crotonobetainyl-CoA:carnitine CoA-transferase CaiB-like acyl-CoA transferase
MAGVLENLRVLDVSWGIAGPMTAMLLADQGADVTKIEPPGGDPFRSQLGYKVWQRGKRSAVLDLKNAEDKATFLALAQHADVLVESYRPGVTQRLGIDFDTLHALNPRLIYCSITAYGRDNKHSQRPGFDALVAARSGLQWEQRGWPEGAINHIMGRPDEFADLEVPYEHVQGPARPGPVFTASHWPSLGAFFCASTAISAALRAREVTGRGQWVETTLLQGAMSGGGGVWQRVENPDAPMFNSWILGSKAPKGHYQCADGNWIHNWVPNPRFIMTAAAGDTLNSSPDLTVQNDPDRFGTAPEEIFVMLHYQPILAEHVKKFTAKEWVDAAAVAGMTMQDVRSPETALSDPLFVEDGCVVEINDPELGPIRQVGVTYKLEKNPVSIERPAPAIGQHTAEVKAEAAALKGKPAANIDTGKKLRAPLEGIRVLDLGLAIAGPYGTQLLADLGADVIKINALYDTYWHSNHIAYCANRGKRSIALNLKDPRAMKILLDLVKDADVVQHNMRYDAVERLGLDYESLKKINPKLVYCHTRGFETGPRSLLPGNDQTGGCLAGVQYEDGGMARGGRPLWAFTSFGDTGNGFLSAVAIMQALYHREKTGEGQFCNTSIVNAHLLNTSYVVAHPDGRGFERPHVDAMNFGFDALTRLYEAKDGWICLVAAGEPRWKKLAEVLGLDGGDARFATAAARAQNDAALGDLIQSKFAGDSAANWLKKLDAAGVPAELSDGEFSRHMHDDPELKKAGWVASYPHPVVGKLDQIGLLMDFSETPGVIQGPPLMVGQHSREIMQSLGYTDADISAACEAGYVAAWGAGELQKEYKSPWAVEKK